VLLLLLRAAAAACCCVLLLLLLLLLLLVMRAVSWLTLAASRRASRQCPPLPARVNSAEDD
jgi:hypothetical protein